VSGRRERLLDAAVELLGGQGVRAVTHRAVDEAAGLPAGSASNLFRTRDALFDGMVDRIVDRERAVWDELAAQHPPTSPAELARTVARTVRAQTTTHRTLTLARYAMLVEAARRPELRPRLLAGGARVNTWFTAWLRLAGSDDPGRDLPILANAVSGLVLHELAIPDPAFDPEPRLRTLLEGVIRTRSSHGRLEPDDR
jgi:AcrR family transcriptional regulator